jgi:hypothetical protein
MMVRSGDLEILTDFYLYSLLNKKNNTFWNVVCLFLYTYIYLYLPPTDLLESVSKLSETQTLQLHLNYFYFASVLNTFGHVTRVAYICLITERYSAQLATHWFPEPT